MNYNKTTMREHALIYERYKDMLHDIPQRTLDMLIRANRKACERISSVLTIKFVNGQPYDSCEQMSRMVEKTGVLLISSDFNDSNLFNEQDNLQFRAVHDWFHIATGQPFGYVGECLTYEVQKGWYPKETHQILFSEICLQAAYADYFGKFPDKQKVILI